MSALPPIYTDHKTTYHADTCQPLVEAVRAGRLRMEALVRGSYPGRSLPRAALPGVCTVGFWDAPCGQEWGLAQHRNEGIEWTFLETGEVDFVLGQRASRLTPDCLTITRPWQPHRVGNPHVGAGRLHWLILDVGVRRPNQPWKWPAWVVLTPADRDRLTTMLRQSEKPVWHAGSELRECFQRIGRAVADDRDGSSVSRLAALINELLVLVLEMFSRQRIELDESLSGSRRTVELLLGELRDDLAQLARPWTLADLAERCGLGPTRFVQLCKQLTNRTPTQYLTHRRVEAATRMLRDGTEQTVSDVARACGFSSGQYFATVFRRHVGQSPGDYRGPGKP